MVDLKDVKQIFLCQETRYFRMGINGLTEYITAGNKSLALEHCLYLFFNRDKSAIKIIEFDDTGTWLYHHKLSDGRYYFPITIEGKTVLDVRQLKIILKSIKAIAHRKNKTRDH